MLFIRIERNKKSYQYKRNPKAKDDWNNNDNNNGLDDFELFDYESRLLSVKCQTVSNIPNGNYLDTIAPGPFLLKCFVEPRNFHCRIHGISETSDLQFEWINDESIQDSNNLRWLLHDDQKQKPNPPNQLTRVLWSAGCIILHKNDLESFNTILDAYGMKTGDTIDAELVDKE